MSLSPVQLLRGAALLAIVVGWAWLAHYGSAGEGSSDLAVILGIGPIVAIVVILLWRVGNPLWIGVGGLAVLAITAWLWPDLRQNVALLYYLQHVGTNLALATLFGRSLFGGGTALITQFALMAHGGVISERKALHTRNATIAWTAFFIATAAISTALYWLAPITAWSVFANLLATPLIILMFIGEYCVRLWTLPPEDQSSVADAIRGYRATMQQRRKTLTNQP